MHPIVLAATRRELYDAVTYYEGKKPGLGYESWEEFDACVGRICQNPEAWPNIAPGVRRSITHRFPYGVVFQVQDDTLIVISVMHLKRNPNSWRDQI